MTYQMGKDERQRGVNTKDKKSCFESYYYNPKFNSQCSQNDG